MLRNLLHSSCRVEGRGHCSLQPFLFQPSRIPPAPSKQPHSNSPKSQTPLAQGTAGPWTVLIGALESILNEEFLPEDNLPSCLLFLSGKTPPSKGAAVYVVILLPSPFLNQLEPLLLFHRTPSGSEQGPPPAKYPRWPTMSVTQLHKRATMGIRTALTVPLGIPQDVLRSA